MKKTLVISLCVLFALTSLTAMAFAKETTGNNAAQLHFAELPQPSPVPADYTGPGNNGLLLSAAAADTFHLAWFSFDNGGIADMQGWTVQDMTLQTTFFHVALEGSELNGGTFGTLHAIEGTKSMWCGQQTSGAAPFCGWSTLPGYGNSWDQTLSATTTGDSAVVSYKIQWDSEPGYDNTQLEVSGDGGATFTSDAGVNAGAGLYDGNGAATEVRNLGVTGAASLIVRFHFTADGAWSDQDGLWPTDGAVLVDSITLATFNGGVPGPTFFSNFEGSTEGDQTDGTWTAGVPAPFGSFGALYPGVTQLQEDPCFTEFSNLWGFFDDPNITGYGCHLPNPRPDQGAMRFGPDANGLYMSNEVWSPLIANVGAGNQYTLSFLTYRDLALDNLQFYVWHVASVVGGCQGSFEDDNFVFYGGQKDWLRTSFDIGAHVNPAATDLRLAVGAVDMCGVWCNVFGSGSCHSHAPLIDEVHLTRVNVLGPQYTVRHLDLFQDNFAQDGTLTGTARADEANDILASSNGNILPGDSITVGITNLGGDPFTGSGPSAYVYVAVWPQGQAAKEGAKIEAPEVRNGKRYPLVDTLVHDGVTWYCFRMDTVVTGNGGIVADRYAFDLNDNVFVPCDTICYFFCADDGLGNVSYFSRRLNGQGGNFVTTDSWEAMSSPMEFTMLPAGGWKRGGDILYVDDVDDRGGPSELFFDTAFDFLSIRDKVDRYDVLGPSSVVSNSLESRVKNITVQLMDCYRKILWNSGNLSIGLLGDGGTANVGGQGPDKSDDYALLNTFLDQHPNGPGLYLSGDNIAEEWNDLVTLGSASATNLKSTFMNFNLVDGDHRNAGEPISPLLTGVGPCFLGDQLVAYGGCALINDFDVLQASGLSVVEFENSASGAAYVLSQTTPAAVDTARVILSGFSYNYVRDTGTPGGFPARVTHLQHILEWLQNIIPFPTGIGDSTPQFANALRNNYPNPFNPTTTIKYSIKEIGHVSLKVYNAAGQLVRTLVNDTKTPQADGFKVTWDGKNNAGQSVSSGVYFYKLVAKNFTQTKKMVLLK